MFKKERRRASNQDEKKLNFTLPQNPHIRTHTSPKFEERDNNPASKQKKSISQKKRAVIEVEQVIK